MGSTSPDNVKIDVDGDEAIVFSELQFFLKYTLDDGLSRSLTGPDTAWRQAIGIFCSSAYLTAETLLTGSLGLAATTYAAG